MRWSMYFKRVCARLESVLTFGCGRYSDLSGQYASTVVYE